MAAAGDDPRRAPWTCSRARSAPGVTTAELDAAAERFIRSQGAAPAFKGYRGFPGSICASPNDMVVHGIPGPVHASSAATSSRSTSASSLDGWVADAARTFAVGEVTPVAGKLLEVTGRRCSTPSSSAVPATGSATSRTRCRRAWRATASRVVRSLVGHGIGRDDARGPPDPQLRPARAAARCSRRAWCSPSSRWSPPGATHVRMGDDGWAIYSQDGSLAAHFEFTIAITAEGPRILTPWHLENGA